MICTCCHQEIRKLKSVYGGLVLLCPKCGHAYSPDSEELPE